MLLLGFLAACGSGPTPGDQAGAATKNEPEAAADKGAPWFTDVAGELGLEFLHDDGRTGQRFYVETSASGGGFLDFDDDGDLDIYLLNGAPAPGQSSDRRPTNALFENRDGRFVDVTERSGTGDTKYGQGMCVGDYDGDGRLDIFISNFGEDVLFRNLGEGRFEDVSKRAGITKQGYGTGCAFGDVDGDGDLDIYVANNVDWSYEDNRQCGFGTAQVLSYCSPEVFPGQVDFLYINQGDGTFTEEGRRRGISQERNDRGFGVIFSDLDDDGDQDIVIANDSSANRFYLNDGKGQFEDISLMSGFAFNADGEPEGGMGIDVADINRDGLQDIIVTNYALESNTLYVNLGDHFFDDATIRAGINTISYNPVGWGCRFFDYDNDGDMDLAVANGHLMDNIEQIDTNLEYHQSNHLMANDGSGKFTDVTQQGGVGFSGKKITRALAVGDFDNDGRLDVLLTNTNDQPDLLHNRLDNGHHWIGFHLEGPAHNRFAIGARVKLGTEKGYLGMGEVRSGGSFQAQSDLRVHFGLGTYTGPVTAEITWPDGEKQMVTLTDLDRYHSIRQGIASGTEASP
jgi:hypothetical protein